MKRFLTAVASAVLFAAAGPAFAQEEYNTVPAGDAEYKQCLARLNDLHTGGEERSSIRGQNNDQAYCSCLWNETPEDFKGNLSKFADSERGKRLDTMCTKYSAWD